MAIRHKTTEDICAMIGAASRCDYAALADAALRIAGRHKQRGWIRQEKRIIDAVKTLLSSKHEDGRIWHIQSGNSFSVSAKGQVRQIEMTTDATGKQTFKNIY